MLVYRDRRNSVRQSPATANDNSGKEGNGISDQTRPTRPCSVEPWYVGHHNGDLRRTRWTYAPCSYRSRNHVTTSRRRTLASSRTWPLMANTQNIFSSDAGRTLSLTQGNDRTSKPASTCTACAKRTAVGREREETVILVVVARGDKRPCAYGTIGDRSGHSFITSRAVVKEGLEDESTDGDDLGGG